MQLLRCAEWYTMQPLELQLVASPYYMIHTLQRSNFSGRMLQTRHAHRLHAMTHLVEELLLLYVNGPPDKISILGEARLGYSDNAGACCERWWKTLVISGLLTLYFIPAAWWADEWG